jgi:aspartyl-tRNA(Asn)/glutamyl-tRNA(Gln) amidotransferase subunit C
MAKLTKADVLYVAKLAKLDLSEAEIKEFLPQLSSVVDHIGELSKVDTSAVVPTSQTTGLENIFRDDKVRPSSIDQDAAISGTDKIYNGYFKVPAILEGRTDK